MQRAEATVQDRVLQLVHEEGATLYSTGAAGDALTAAVDELCSSNACQRPGPDSVTEGQGTWEVRACVCLQAGS